LFSQRWIVCVIICFALVVVGMTGTTSPESKSRYKLNTQQHKEEYIET
jgi:hypothetical protein